MTLEDAIVHLDESLSDQTHDWGCKECKKEHEQLKAWLVELKGLKDSGVRSTKHGRWEHHEFFDVFEYRWYSWVSCSECGENAHIDRLDKYVRSNFCPNCGADMREVF